MFISTVHYTELENSVQPISLPKKERREWRDAFCNSKNFFSKFLGTIKMLFLREKQTSNDNFWGFNFALLLGNQFHCPIPKVKGQKLRVMKFYHVHSLALPGRQEFSALGRKNTWNMLIRPEFAPQLFLIPAIENSCSHSTRSGVVAGI